MNGPAALEGAPWGGLVAELHEVIVTSRLCASADWAILRAESAPRVELR
jgi:hypothetical protein